MFKRIRETFQQLKYRYYWLTRGRRQAVQIRDTYRRVWGAAENGELESAISECEVYLTAAKTKPDYTEYINLLLLRAELAFRRDDVPLAQKLYEECLEICRPQGADLGTAAAVQGLGRVAAWEHRHSEALDLFQKCLEMVESYGATEQQILARLYTARVHQVMGDYFKARRLTEEAQRLSISIGDRECEAAALSVMGSINAGEGQIDHGRAYYQQCLEIHQERDDKHGIASALSSIAFVSDKATHDPSDRFRLKQALTIFCSLRLREAESYALHNLGMWHFRSGDLSAAREVLRQSLTIKLERGDIWGSTYTFEALGMLESAVGNDAAAAMLMGFSDAVRTQTESKMEQFLRPDFDAAVTATRDRMGEAAFAASFAQGSELSVQDAADLVMETTG